MPGVVERFDLCLCLGARVALEQDVVGAVRVERRVEVDEVHGLGFESGEHVEVVAVVEAVLPVGHSWSLVDGVATLGWRGMVPDGYAPLPIIRGYYPLAWGAS